MRDVMLLPLLAASVLAVPPDFVRDVRPILSDRCFSCHGPDDQRRMANLRLDSEDGARAAIASGKFMARVTHEKKALRMPPPGQKELSGAQIDTLKNWISQGAPWREHWSYTPVRRAPLPAVKNAASAVTPIDRFILARLEKESLRPSPEAGRATLLRRLSLDLTGLPPTPEETAAYLADRSPQAYEKLVDRLLASPHYGERMALQWLDLARYADTHGYHIDSHRDMWAWRDWVISAFNRNMPFDQFTIWQLAGDLLPGATPEQKLATAFQRNHMINYEGGAIPEEYLTEYVIDRVEVTANVFMGMTAGCARCHDHKYDPIKQRDFYRLFAFYNTIAEKGLDGSRGNAAPILPLPDGGQRERQRTLRERLAAVESWLDSIEVDGLRETWERSASLASPPETSPDGRAAASLRLKMSARLDSQPTRLLDVPYPVWIDGGEAIGRNRRGSYFWVARDGQVMRTRRQFVTGEWMNLAVSGGELWVEGEKQDLVLEPGAEVPKPFVKGSREQERHYARPLTAAEIKQLAVEEPVRLALAVEPKKRSREQRLTILDYYLAHAAPVELRQMAAEWQRLNRQREELEFEIPSAMVLAEMPAPRVTKVLARGDYRNGTEVVTPGVPGFLPPLKPGAPANRLGLAQWLVSAEHPLTARVAVNRVWQLFFGQGIVKTVEDFGSQGEYPVHPELLDWLASEFVSSGWDMKALQKKIVMSSAYRQSSRATPQLVERDPENRLVARGPRVRLQAELIRDQALAASGLLVKAIGGPSVMPYHPAGVWEEIAYGDTFSAQKYVQDRGDKLYRRSMYTFWKRTAPPATMAIFDAPDREKCIARRAVTNTPLQALALLNDPTFTEAARALAARAMAQPDPIAYLYQAVLQRRPSPREAAVLKSQSEKQLAIYRNHREGATQLLAVGESPVPAGVDAARLAAWTTVASVVLNLDEAITKE
jgi:cytochrome c553